VSTKIRVKFDTPQPRPAITGMDIYNDSPSPEGVRLHIKDGTISAYIADVFGPDGADGVSSAREIRVKVPPTALQQIKQAFLQAGRADGSIPPGPVEEVDTAVRVSATATTTER
jgi:hypothetical protein